jgi:heme-degrading monooxygenase HmoA
MVKMQPLDQHVTIMDQLESNVSPVVLVNVFQVDEVDIPALLKAWENDANWMKQQPGYISTQLHRGIAGSTVFMNYAIWDSVEDFRNAFQHPEFQAAMGEYPDSAVASPHLFSRVAIPNLCTG